jgi:FkbM family methyltransferase
MPQFKIMADKNPENEFERIRAETFFTKEPETIAWINSFTEPDGVFLDIGANIGLFSLYCAQKYPGMTIQAFEPLKANCTRLFQNILLNDYQLIISHYLVAVGRHCGVAHFDTAGIDDVGGSGGQLSKDGYPIQAVTVDWISLSGRVPSYIKIDTDGNEYDIIRGMKNTLRSKKLKGVLVEVNNHTAEIIAIMFNAGFEFDTEAMRHLRRVYDYNLIFTRKQGDRPCQH